MAPDAEDLARKWHLTSGTRQPTYFDTEDDYDVFSNAKEHHVLSASEGASENLILRALKQPLSVFTTSLADADLETLNTQVPFDTDSIFFVCDNSTTGHICNDVRKFVPGSIRSTARRLTTANGTGACV